MIRVGRAGAEPLVRARRKRPAELLASRLTALYETYDLRHLDPDPLVLVRRYPDPRDQEIAGLVAAAFAYGGVETIVRDVADLFARMDCEPYGFVMRFVPKRDVPRLRGWYHRLHRGEDAARLVGALRWALEEFGSLAALFSSGFEPQHRDVGRALAIFVQRLREHSPDVGEASPYYLHLLSSPTDGSACKRMNLFLRWMVRRSAPDLGLWKHIPPSHLVIPLDTHVARIARYIGLTGRRTADWRMARQVTDSLRAIDAEDPVKFDYAICRLGILEACPQRRDRAACSSCPLEEICDL